MAVSGCIGRDGERERASEWRVGVVICHLARRIEEKGSGWQPRSGSREGDRGRVVMVMRSLC